jgi:hypothetical protein
MLSRTPRQVMVSEQLYDWEESSISSARFTRICLDDIIS